MAITSTDAFDSSSLGAWQPYWTEDYSFASAPPIWVAKLQRRQIYQSHNADGINPNVIRARSDTNPKIVRKTKRDAHSGQLSLFLC